MLTRFWLVILLPVLLMSCSASRNVSQASLTDTVAANIDLVDVQKDQVTVTIIPPIIQSETIAFKFPKIIPGTYAISDYGRYIEGLQAFDRSGKKMGSNRTDSNTWIISNATQLGKITYQVNDTYDSEPGGSVFEENSRAIFSPTGTNILAGKNFVLNLCGFVGYFAGKLENPYSIHISHPINLYGATSMIDDDPANETDLFISKRYADIIDCPIMYSEPDLARFTVKDMEVLLSVYSPRNKALTASVLEPDLKKMITAQKNFLGDLSSTKKYAVLTYLTNLAKNDATGIGALEHNASTSSVFRDNMTSEDLVHVISHEFFHTVTPLKIHSKEIHYFDFDAPKMSQHLWFYEGITEYFAQFFQCHEGLISENQLLDRFAGMETNSKKNYSDSLSFTYMSKHILEPKMKTQFPNVYQKGALIGMCLDLILRKNSNGERGLLSLVKQLSELYGAEKPFDDDAFIPEIGKITYPEVAAFLQEHVVTGTPIDYLKYLDYAGIERETVPVEEPIAFLHNDKLYIKKDASKKKLIAYMPDDKNAFMNHIGLKDGDVILAVNSQPFSADNVMASMMSVYKLPQGKPLSISIERDGKKMELAGTAKPNFVNGPGYRFKDAAKKDLKDAWLKG